MTLRDALAAALYGYLWSEPPEGRCLDEPEEWYCPPNELADAILSDPAFRAALTEAVAEALPDTVLGKWLQRGGEPNQAFWDRDAAAIVDRMLPAEVGK